MTLEMSPEQIQESKIYREWGLTDEEYLKSRMRFLMAVCQTLRKLGCMP